MPASKISETADSVSSKNTASLANDTEDLDDFVLVSPGCCPEPSAPFSTVTKDDWTEVIKIARTEDSLFEKVSTTLIHR